MKSRTKTLLVVGAAVFGAFYSAIATVLNLAPFMTKAPLWLNAIAQIAFALLIVLVVYATMRLIDRSRMGPARKLGFLFVLPQWFPRTTEQRVGDARKYMTELLGSESWPVRVCSVTGEWDICKPFTEKQLRELLKPAAAQIEVLLAHPLSPGLQRRCHEEGLDLKTMQRRVIHSTNFLLAAAGDRVKIGWYMSAPHFHLISDGATMHFSPFIDGIQGHDTPRYAVNSEHPLCRGLNQWFKDELSAALDAKLELSWVERSLEKRDAVFLDRDDTIVADIAYVGDARTVQMRILPGVIDGLRLLQRAGLRLIVVSNQHPVGLNIVDPEELALLTKRIKQAFVQEGVHFDAFYYCKHRESEGCHCRKPGSQLFEQAAKQFDLDLGRCHFIGNARADEDVKYALPQMEILVVRRPTDFLRFARTIARQRGISATR